MTNDIARHIRKEIRRETRRSRYRDSRSGEKVHPIDHDLNRLITFIIDNHKENPAALDAARHHYRTVDTKAWRLMICVVREGPDNAAMLRVCKRIETYADAVDTALALKSYLLDEQIPEDVMDDRAKVLRGAITAVKQFGDAQVTAEVAERTATLPYTDRDTFTRDVLGIALDVWKKKLARATARDTEAQQRADALAAMNALPQSKKIH